MRTDDWCRLAIRVYQPKDEKWKGKAAYLGWWIKDLKNGRWYYHSTVRLMCPVTGFASNGSFVETLAHGKVHLFSAVD